MNEADSGDDSPPKEDFSKENERLGMSSPVKTVAVLSIGPFVSRAVLTLYGLVDSLWVANTIGRKGISVFGVVFIVEFFAVAISQWLMAGLSIRTSFLFGEGRTGECAQMYIDFIRLSFIFGVLTPVIVLPLTKPMVMWFGADAELANMAFEYMIPIGGFCVLNFLYTIGCGFLQAGGRSIAYGLIQMGSLVLNMGVFDPLFLVALKTPMWGASLATILAEGIPGVILTGLVLSGKLGVKPRWRMFLSAPTKESWTALKVGVPTLIASLSWNVPLTIMQKFVNMAASAVGAYETVVAIWAVIQKLSQIVGACDMAVAYGMVPAAAFAYGAGRLNRVLQISVHALWISTLLSSILAVTLMVFPVKIAKIWSKDEDFLYWAKLMIPISAYTSPSWALQIIVPSVLQSMQRVTAATLVSVITLLLPWPTFSAILYFTKKDDPARIMWTYALNDGFSVIVSLLFMIEPGRVLWAAKRDKELMSEIQEGLLNPEFVSEESNEKTNESGDVVFYDDRSKG